MIYLVDMEHPGLVVFPTHRLVRDLPNFDKEAVLEKCSEFFYIDEKEGTDTMEEDLKNSMTMAKSIRFLLRQGRMVLADTQKYRHYEPNAPQCKQGVTVA